MLFRNYREEYETDGRKWHAKNARLAFVLLMCVGFWTLIAAAL